MRKYVVLFLVLLFCASAHALCIRSIQYDRSTGTLSIYGIGSEFFSITKAAIVNFFQTQTSGTVAQRKQQTRQWVAAQALAAMPSTVDPNDFQVEIDTTDGTPNIVEAD